MHCCDRHQKGVALLMAMLVVSMASVIAVSLVHEQALSIRKTSHIQSNEISLMYALGLEDYARLILQKDFKDSKIDDLSEDWAIGIPGLPIQGGFLSGQLMDAQALININSISKKETEDRLRALCDNLEISHDFISALKDWVDQDLDSIDADGAEDDYYTSLEIPYRTGNRRMSDISELLLVKGIDFEKYSKLKAFITALPVDTNLNLNTIPPEIYLTIDNNLDAEKFISERESDPFSSLENYKNRMNHTLPLTGLSVSTEYFKADGQVVLGEKSLTIKSLFYRDKKGVTQVISRKLGEFS